MSKYIHGRTCVYNINYHIVWCVKYRLVQWNPVTVQDVPVLRWGEKETFVGKPSSFKLLKTMLTNKAVGE